VPPAERIATFDNDRTSRGRRCGAAAIGHALEFGTWQSLVRRQGCTAEETVPLMLGLARAAAD
jgi:hypothetical protein